MKYFLFILGCAMNYSDAERLSSVLNSLGYSKTEKEQEADIIFVISCSVRQTAIDRIYGKTKLWNKIKEKRPLKLALSGCVLEKDRKKMQEIFDFVFDIKDLSLLPNLLDNQTPKTDPEDYFSIHPKYESNFQAYVPVSTGCNNFCSYCAVPYTRGREKSRMPEDIIKEVMSLVESGYKEITLLGQNVNSYGQDLDPGSAKDSRMFVDLLEHIDRIPGDFRVYFYSNHPKDMSDLLIKTLPKLNHFPNYIHLPLQSGNDEIIRKMNRQYTKEKYLILVEEIRGAIPDVVLTTDIIVGFPGEDEKAFQDTAEVMEKAKFDMAFIAQYSPREGTVSAKIPDDVPKEVKKKRDAELVKTLENTVLEHNKKLQGKELKVLVDGAKGDRIFGRTEGYKVVEIKTDRKDLIGQFVMVKIGKVGPWKLGGELP